MKRSDRIFMILQIGKGAFSVAEAIHMSNQFDDTNDLKGEGGADKLSDAIFWGSSPILNYEQRNRLENAETEIRMLGDELRTDEGGEIRAFNCRKKNKTKKNV